MNKSSSSLLMLSHEKREELVSIVDLLIKEDKECPSTVVAETVAASMDYFKSTGNREVPDIAILTGYGLHSHIAEMFLSKKLLRLVYDEVILLCLDTPDILENGFEIEQDHNLLQGLVKLTVFA